MMRFIISLVVIIFIFFIDKPSAQITDLYDNSYALVIGINIYPEPTFKNLKSAVPDAVSVATFLKKQGFKVITLFNDQATRDAIIYQMQNNLARRLKKNDRIIFFFAGHGYTESIGDNDFGYIVPYNGKTSSSSYLSMEEIQAQSKKMSMAKHQLFILDCCFGGLLSMRDIPGATNIPGYIKDVTKRPARQILTAGGKNQRVVDTGAKNHSVFTLSLLEALEQSLADQNRDGYITFSEMCSYVVPRATNAFQTPGPGTLPGHGQGEFVFISPAGAKKTVVQPISDGSESFRSEAKIDSTKKRPIIKPSTHKTGDVLTEPLTNMELVWISGGCFMMGCDEWAAPCEDFEKPVNEVCLDGYWIGKTEVTQGQWKTVMNNNPAANDIGDTYPVELINWTQALNFIDQLNQHDKKSSFALPTEAQWEYACRSQGKKEKYSGGNQAHSFAWFSGNSKNMTHPVAKKKSNQINLFDMSGNVQEWCLDVYGFDAYARMNDSQLKNTIYQGNESGRVIRGGSWGLSQKYCRCVSRQGMQPELESGLVGFRVVKNE